MHKPAIRWHTEMCEHIRVTWELVDQQLPVDIKYSKLIIKEGEFECITLDKPVDKTCLTYNSAYKIRVFTSDRQSICIVDTTAMIM